METLARPHRRPGAGGGAGHLEAHFAALVDAVPALTSEQARRLRTLLDCGHPMTEGPLAAELGRHVGQ